MIRLLAKENAELLAEPLRKVNAAWPRTRTGARRRSPAEPDNLLAALRLRRR